MRRIPRRAVDALREGGLLLGLWVVYEVGRKLGAGREAAAYDHAELVHRLEAALHLPDEAALQAAVGSPTLYRAADIYYVGVHFPLVLLFLGWGFLRRPRAEYRWARDLLVLQSAGALVLHLAFPLAPPRMFPDWGFVDTMSTYGPSAYAGDSGGGGFANQLAAMPSLHFGWAALAAYVVARTGPRWLAVLTALWPVTTLAVIVVTANHWWLDAAVALVLLGLADLVLRGFSRRRAPRERPAAAVPPPRRPR